MYPAWRVLPKQDHDDRTGILRFNLVGVKNETPISLIRRGVDLFEDKLDQKVFEIERKRLPSRASGLSTVFVNGGSDRILE